MIRPTIGRQVWFRRCQPTHNELPEAATIVNVFSDRSVNLQVIDGQGVARAEHSVLLHQQGDPQPDGSYCEWMPYQKGQAKADFVGSVSAFDQLKTALRLDPDYAWAWHCNVAMPILDHSHGLLTHRQANELAADVMLHLFGIDIRASHEWRITLPNWGSGFVQDGR